jgi:FkbM family methyltransferase
LKANPLVFDLGAHQCVVAMMVAHAFGPASKIIAVEGSRYNVEIARRNIEANGFRNVEVVNALVSSRDGVGSFTNAWCGTVASDGQNFGTESVAALCIDSLQQRFGAPQLVYMDIEGFEFEALKGGEQALSTGAIWVIEAHGDEQLRQYGASNGHIVEHFLDRGFETWFALEGSATFSKLDRDAVVPGVRCYLLAVPKTAASLKQFLARQSEA